MDGDLEVGYVFIGGGFYIGFGVFFEMMKKCFFGIIDIVLRWGGVNVNLFYFVSVFEVVKGGIFVMNGNCFICYVGEVNG